MTEISMIKFLRKGMIGVGFGHLEIGRLDIIWNLGIGTWNLDYRVGQGLSLVS
jgi:hypothetical protein